MNDHNRYKFNKSNELKYFFLSLFLFVNLLIYSLMAQTKQDFQLNHSHSVIYVETEFQPEINRYIRENYSKLIEQFGQNRINFYYLPLLLKENKISKITQYNRPYVSFDVGKKDIQALYNRLISKKNLDIQNGALLYIENAERLNKWWTFQSNVSPYLDKEFEEKRIEIFNYSAALLRESFQTHFGDVEIFYQKSIPTHQSKSFDFRTTSRKINETDTADYWFSEEAFELTEEIRERIEKLKEIGSLSLVLDLFEEIKGATKKLSKLYITDDYRIFLQDYGMKEVVMTPLPKSLFFLFLNHPEGILFKRMGNYFDELLSIYKKISQRENIDAMINSIKAMTNPLDNSINEKCSRIRQAFLQVVADDIAKNYYITGNKGKRKKIVLNRNLVHYQSR